MHTYVPMYVHMYVCPVLERFVMVILGAIKLLLYAWMGQGVVDNC